MDSQKRLLFAAGLPVIQTPVFLLATSMRWISGCGILFSRIVMLVLPIQQAQGILKFMNAFSVILHQVILPSVIRENFPFVIILLPILMPSFLLSSQVIPQIYLYREM